MPVAETDRALEARFAALERRVAALEQATRPRPAVHDEAAEAALLAVIARRVEGRVFSARSLIHHARLHDDLRDALGACGVTTSRALGTLFGAWPPGRAARLSCSWQSVRTPGACGRCCMSMTGMQPLASALASASNGGHGVYISQRAHREQYQTWP